MADGLRLTWCCVGGRLALFAWSGVDPAERLDLVFSRICDPRIQHSRLHNGEGFRCSCPHALLFRDKASAITRLSIGLQEPRVHRVQSETKSLCRPPNRRLQAGLGGGRGGKRQERLGNRPSPVSRTAIRGGIIVWRPGHGMLVPTPSSRNVWFRETISHIKV